LTFFIRDRRRFPSLPFAYHAFIVALLLADFVPLGVLQLRPTGPLRDARKVRAYTVGAVRVKKAIGLRLRQRWVSGSDTRERQDPALPGSAQTALVRRVRDDHQIVSVG